jgi:nitrogen fixation NifU-like protein
MEETKHNETDILQAHSLHFLEMAFRTDKRQIIKNPDGYGKRTHVCGDAIEIFLIIKDNRIQSISYYTEGCMNTNACGNAVVLLTEGKSVEQAWEIRPENITEYLQTLPPHETHCTEMAVGALHLALSDYQEMKKAPWKKAYQRVNR